MALKTGTKKLTKKEILLHVLNYIQFLQKSIDVAKALLELHTTAGKGGLGGLGQNPTEGPARWRYSTPSSSLHSHKSRLRGACQKPRKKKLARASERQTRAQNPRRCLALDKPKKQATPSPDRKGGNGYGRVCTTTTTTLAWRAVYLPASVRISIAIQLKDFTFLKASGCCGKNAAQGVDLASPAFEAQQGLERIHLLTKTQASPRQKLVFYDPSEEVDKESPDADPWLPAWSPEGCPHGSPLALGPPQIDNWSLTGHPSEILGLRPSLFSSPGKLLPEQILEDGPEDLSQALFAEAYLDPASSPSACGLQGPEKDTPPGGSEDPPDSHSLCQSSFSLDHCYLSLSENSRALSSPSSEATDTDTDSDTDSERRPQEGAEADREGPPSSSNEDEDGDYTWTPTRRATALPAAGRKARKGRAGRGPVRPKESKKAPCPPQTKKKCVNGFIMFCRMNRKQYIRWLTQSSATLSPRPPAQLPWSGLCPSSSLLCHFCFGATKERPSYQASLEEQAGCLLGACPGTASTAATKELAQLWRVMTLQERRPYCIKARRFSRQHNRIVKQDSSSSEDEDWETPKPFYQLLAEKARCSPAPAPPLPPHHV
ncbi:basic helix-loop-helix and HMG box domain-containing protein 1 [Sus scrofa]|uniref:basic helix-loop-helix and HMG box domain-containing protein 1 n=1 Tax=Sus scrofa TaxID=9823 RepID=UPI000A2B54CF|nr:basic helix-loop-helix and HMG box domain-containing protein 1 [Sus scrofa]